MINLKEQSISVLNRMIAHTIHPKTSERAAYSVSSDKCLDFSDQDKGILIGRLHDALCNSKKTFKLSYEDLSTGSLYDTLHNNYPETDQEFITKTQYLAGELADAHFRTKIPGGYCLIGEGYTEHNQHLFFIIKAELQEVFTIRGNSLKTVKDVFLSPAKDFYKIGFFIKEEEKYVPYMYDDQFSLQKKDLTEYFYGKFMGLTTDKNDSLRCKNFYEDVKRFIQDNVSNAKDQLGLIKALGTLYREDTKGTISPREFGENYLEGKLKIKFDKLVDKKYPQPFIKDTTLIDKRLNLNRISIPLEYSLSLVGNGEVLDKVEIYDKKEGGFDRNVLVEIHTGITQTEQIIVVKTHNS